MRRALLALVPLLSLAACAGERAPAAPPPAPGALLHFKPREHALGDVHPFFRAGECFLYYLKPGGFDSALARPRDLITFSEAPLTHGPVAPESWHAPYFVLGVVRDQAAGGAARSADVRVFALRPDV